MSGKPTYEELEQRLKELEKEALEHNRTEKALGVAEHKLRELYRAVEQSSEGIATASLDGNFVFTNPTWAEMHGYQPDELVGQPVGMLDSPEDREKLPAIWQEIKKNGFWRGELQRVRKNGSSFPATMTSSLVRDDRDTPFVIIGTCRDITERKLAEDELKRAHDELERQVEERTAELKAQSNRLKKANTALKVLLEQSEVHKKELEGKGRLSRPLPGNGKDYTPFLLPCQTRINLRLGRESWIAVCAPRMWSNCTTGESSLMLSVVTFKKS